MPTPAPWLIECGLVLTIRCSVLLLSCPVWPARVAQAYMYGEGLARFAASNYSRNATNGGRRDQYLTNTSVGKLVAALSKLTWTFAKLRGWFGAHGHDPDAIFAEIHRAVASVLLLSEPRFREHFAANLEGHSCTGCYQLLGIDVIFNAKLEPKVIEVNGLPSMQLSHNQSDVVNPRDDCERSSREDPDTDIDIIAVHPNPRIPNSPLGDPCGITHGLGVPGCHTARRPHRSARTVWLTRSSRSPRSPLARSQTRSGSCCW